MQHVIIRIREAIIHDKRQYDKAMRRFIAQDVLAQRGGYHVFKPLDSGRCKHVRGERSPEGRIYEHKWWCYVHVPRGHIFRGLLLLSLLSTNFSSYSAMHATDGTVPRCSLGVKD